MALRARTAARVSRSLALVTRTLREDVLAGATAELICLACGTTLTGSLANGGAIRCHDCRAADSPVDATLLGLQRSLSRTLSE
jgi:hypothetical protein